MPETSNIIIDHTDRNLVAAEATISITLAAKIMAEKKVDSLVLKENGIYCGIVTATDFLHKAIAQELNCSKTPVSSIASKPLFVIDGNKSMKDALLVMIDKNIRNITVLEYGEPVGLIKLKNIASYFLQNSPNNSDPITKFWSRYNCREGKTNFIDLVQELLNDVKESLDNSSPTAIAISRDTSWEEISQCAEEESLYELAQILALSKIS
jgi:signal-transduction protein with cAMP-binding, CBS, and nucleotidyltransferase domain